MPSEHTDQPPVARDAAQARGTVAPKLKLPIGIQTFRRIREEGHYYVDKTPWIKSMVEGGAHHFLSRPRRFGKSLLLDTIKELFEGSEDLFRGLAIHDGWDWSARHPVLRLDWSAGSFGKPGDVEQVLMEQLDAIEARNGLEVGFATGPGRFARLIEALSDRAGQRVVVLVDEYDKPILDALETPNVARANRDFLRGLYGAIKFSDAHIAFSLLTGVSKFSRVSLFSGLNNLIDLTLDPRYGAVCGYTEADLREVFAPELGGFDREAIREWYNGYRWGDGDPVYNPFDLLLLFHHREFGPYWFETGTPTFLIDLLARRQVDTFALDGVLAGAELLSSFDVDVIEPEALLFQTGYLTIRDAQRFDGETTYELGYPNREVRQSLNRSLLAHLTAGSVGWAEHRIALHRALEASDFDRLEALLRALFAGIPFEWHTKNDIARYEGYYASVVYSCFAALGLDVRAEESSARGRLDMAVHAGERVYLFELKVAERSSEGAAMKQLLERGYADKYGASGGPVHLIAIEFSEAERGIERFEVRSVDA